MYLPLLFFSVILKPCLGFPKRRARNIMYIRPSIFRETERVLMDIFVVNILVILV